eukprot:gene44405-55219_t
MSKHQKGPNNGNASNSNSSKGNGKSAGSGAFNKGPHDMRTLHGGGFRDQARPGEPRSTGFLDGHDPQFWDKITLGKSSKVFSGGSAVEFKYWAQGFEMMAIAEGVWSMFEPPTGATQAITDALQGTGSIAAIAAIDALVEDYFTELRPEEALQTAVRRRQDQKLQALHDLWEQRVYDLQVGPGTAAERDLRKDQALKEWTDKRFAVENSAEQIQGHMIKQISLWDQAKKRHEERTAKCFKLFMTYLGKGPFTL